MSLLLALTIGILVAIGVLQIVQRDVLRIVVGLYTFWNALNLFILAVASTRGVRAPLAHTGSGPMADPLVQAMVLTAIVITFGFTAFLVTLVLWLAQRGDSIAVTRFMSGRDHEPQTGQHTDRDGRSSSGEEQE